MKITKFVKSVYFLLLAIVLPNGLAAKPLRIVSVNGTLSEIISGLGLEKQLVGVDVTSTYPASLEKIPKIGHNRSIAAEGIIALNPDVIVYTDQSMVTPSVIKQLSSSGKKLVEFKHEYSKEGAVKLIREVGAYFNAKSQAEKLVTSLEADLSGIPKPSSVKKLLFIYARGTGTLMVSGTGTSLDKMFLLTGNKNAVQGFTDFKPLTSEALLVANPDVLVLFSSGLESLDGAEGLLKLPGVANTTAGKNKKIVTMDGQFLTGTKSKIDMQPQSVDTSELTRLNPSVPVGGAVSTLGVAMVLGLILLACVVFSACIGALPISLAELWQIVLFKIGLSDTSAFEEQQALVFWIIRLPRICLAVLVGAGLGIAGASLQGLFRNPIADSTLIGVTSGASLFAVFVIMLNIKYLGIVNEVGGAYTISLVSFFGAAVTTSLVYQLSKITGEGGVTTMLLCGIAINAFVGSITGLMTYLASDEQLRSITFWNLGSLGGATWTSVMAVAPFVLCSVIFMPYLAKALNLLVLGESQAAALGVNMTLLKRQVVILATMGVGASVAVAGTIGFVGLVVPHIIRSTFGPDHKTLLVGSALGGSIVLTLADTISRTIVAPSELPIGILTALLGTPFFLYILWDQRSKRI